MLDSSSVRPYYFISVTAGVKIVRCRVFPVTARAKKGSQPYSGPMCIEEDAVKNMQISLFYKITNVVLSY